MLGFGNRNTRTFRPKKNTPVGSKGLQLQKHIQATLIGGEHQGGCQTPAGGGPAGEFCTDRTCEVMSAGGKYEYLWADGVKVKKPVRLSAPEYIDKLFDWIETQVDDEAVFPQQFGAAFPHNFMDVTKTIYKRMFRVYAHIYHSHYVQVCSLGEDAHFNTCFKHFIFFTLNYNLVDEKELVPLQELIDKYMGRDSTESAA
ncbi:MAG: hypothetical protein WDW38_008876 [Sanguina aurantia]